MDLSIIILTWNSEHYIESCIESLLTCLNNNKITYEILLVDNGSKDMTPALLQRYVNDSPESIMLFCMAKNVGTTVSRNFALRKASGRYICIMDSDVEMHENVFDQLITVLEEDSTIGLTVPKIFYPSGNWQKSYDQFPTFFHKLNRFFRLKSIELREAEQMTTTAVENDVDYAISAFWLFPRDILKSVGFLDERIFYSPEDVDYCLRIWKAGFRIVYVPKVWVVHHTQEISRGWKINMAKLSHIKGLIYFFVKHGYFFRSPRYWSC